MELIEINEVLNCIWYFTVYLIEPNKVINKFNGKKIKYLYSLYLFYVFISQCHCSGIKLGSNQCLGPSLESLLRLSWNSSINSYFSGKSTFVLYNKLFCQYTRKSATRVNILSEIMPYQRLSKVAEYLEKNFQHSWLLQESENTLNW